MLAACYKPEISIEHPSCRKCRQCATGPGTLVEHTPSQELLLIRRRQRCCASISPSKPLSHVYLDVMSRFLLFLPSRSRNAFLSLGTRSNLELDWSKVLFDKSSTWTRSLISNKSSPQTRANLERKHTSNESSTSIENSSWTEAQSRSKVYLKWELNLNWSR